MPKTTIRLSIAMAVLTLLIISGCSSHFHHHNKGVGSFKTVVLNPVVIKKVIARPVIKKNVVVQRRVVIIKR